MRLEPSTFEKTPEFEHFKEAMRGVLAVPKKEVDRRLREASASSPSKNNPITPGRKRAKRKR